MLYSLGVTMMLPFLVAVSQMCSQSSLNLTLSLPQTSLGSSLAFSLLFFSILLGIRRFLVLVFLKMKNEKDQWQGQHREEFLILEIKKNSPINAPNSTNVVFFFSALVVDILDLPDFLLHCRVLLAVLSIFLGRRVALLSLLLFALAFLL